MKFRKYLNEATPIKKKGDKVRVPHKGKMVDGKVVRYVPQRGAQVAYYVVYVGETASIEVPVHKISEGIDEAGYVPLKTAIKKLLDKAKGTTQDDLHYRAYLNAVLQKQPTEHLIKKFKGSKKARQDLLDMAGMKESASVRSLTSHIPRDYLSKTFLKAGVKNKLNKQIHTLLKPTYFDSIPLSQIFNILIKQGITPLQEDQTAWSGFLLGGRKKTEQVYFNLGWTDTKDKDKRMQAIPNSVLSLSYYIMPESGRYEVIAYIT